MAIPYPCLDTGYIYDPGKKLDRLMSDFYESEWSQSYLFQDRITSFPRIIQMYQNDPTVATNTTRDGLSNLLGKYFDNTDIQAAVLDRTSSTYYDMRLYAVVTQDGVPIKLSTQLKITGTQFERTLQTRE